jgi:formylglycine-generating enzyme required for sulfatase activity
VFVWGRRFHPAWTSSCFSQPKAHVEPVMSYPIDQSWCGAYDMCGSAFEWIDGWFDESRGLRRLAGGSWARAQPELFRIEGGLGAGPTAAGDEYGFRLVARPVGQDR